jgi:hypothetical protein
VTAGLKRSADSDDVVIASNGQSVLLHVKNHDRARITALVRFLEQKSWVDVIFTGGRIPSPGTFSLALVHEASRNEPPIFSSPSHGIPSLRISAHPADTTPRQMEQPVR